VVGVQRALGALEPRSVRPAAPALLTSDGPLGARIAPLAQIGASGTRPFGVWESAKGIKPPSAPTIISRGRYYNWAPAILGGNDRLRVTDLARPPSDRIAMFWILDRPQGPAYDVFMIILCQARTGLELKHNKAGVSLAGSGDTGVSPSKPPSYATHAGPKPNPSRFAAVWFISASAAGPAESRINLLHGTPRRCCGVDETRDWSRHSQSR
jgi:hypothetical protein